MDDDLGKLSVRELIMRLADTEDTIRRTATFSTVHADGEHQPVNGRLIDLAQAEERIIAELRRRENAATPTTAPAWPAVEERLAG